MKYCIHIFALCFGLLTLSLSHNAVAQIELNCADGIDNNGKDGIDCQDPSCASYALCYDEGANNNCSDGIDNDGDGKIDCADNDPEDCDCTQEEICNNYIDDDGDTLIDCKDDECDGHVTCEDCDNWVDDDGNGFVDYYDGDCLDDPNNPNDYIVIKPDCEARPQGNVFDINEAWRSDDRTASSRGIPIIADIDSDGTPEVISNNENNRIVILSGINGVIEREVTYTSNLATNNYNNSHLAVGEVDNDGYGEIFHLEMNGWIRAFNHDLTPIWKTRSTMRAKRPPLLADFNNDGEAELYFGNEIRNALTGAEIVRGSDGSTMYSSGNDWSTELNGYPVAIDILPESATCTTCDGLELVLGHIIYAVDIDNGVLTEARTMDNVGTKVNYAGDYYPKDPQWGGQNYSSTAVVDFNGDGNLDILMSGATGSSTGPSTVFLWDLANDRTKAYVVTRPATEFNPAATVDIRKNFQDLNGGTCNGTDLCTWKRGVGSLNVANIDSDPSDLECTFMSGSSLYAITSDMEEKWTNHTDFWESTSGVTGTAVFDFDGDGASEVIYRDQVDLYIVDGENGQILNSQYASLIKCSSQTTDEYPVIADVDGDGETEIVVTCGKNENERYEDSNNSGNTNKQSHIRAYKAAEGQFWVPARRIWNQYTYFNVNVNDNMTIPRYQQPHHLNFSQICNDPTAPNRFSLNKFLNQSPRITFCGDLAFPASRLEFPEEDAVIITPPICPEDSFEVTLNFENTGEYTVNQPVPFAFYAQDPAQSYANTDPNPWLDTVYISVPGGIKQWQKVSKTVKIRGARGVFTLYVSMNDIGPFDKGTKTPLANADFYPLDEFNGTVRVCDGEPIVVSKLVDPIPFEMIVSSTDNRRCENKDAAGNDIGINNGEIKITDKDGNPLTPLSNYEISLINTRTNDPVDISTSLADLDDGTFINNLDSGTYAVSAQYQNDAFSCGSVVDTVTINRNEGWPSAAVMTVEKLKDVSSCKPGTADGEARVLINGVAPDTVTYKVRWQNEEDPLDVFLGSSLKNLKEKTYLIFVTNRVTGCELNDSSLVMDLPRPVQADPTVTHATNCKKPNGTITAKMASGPIAQYDFLLVQKSPVQDTTFSDNGSFTDLAEGIYELIAYDPTNDCGLYSEGVEVIIETQSTLPELTLTQVSPQTACDPAFVNGHLRATPSSAGSYAYTWFKGTVTSGSMADTVGLAADATGLSTYNNPSQLFTVVMVDKGSGCSVSDTVRLFEQLTYPEIDPADVNITARTYCNSLNGEINVSVGGTTTNFTFDLYKGTTATGTPFAQSPDGNFTGLDSVQYTLVAIDTRTGCATPAPQALTVKVPGNTKAPLVVPTVTNQSSCDPNDPNGEISVTADGSTSTIDYTFDWLDEAGNSYNTPAIAELKRGNYLLTVTNTTTRCDTTLTVFVDDEIYEGDDLNIVLDIDNVDYCSPFNGRIEVTDVVVNGNSMPISNYTFEWYKVENPGLDSTLIVDQNGDALTGSILNNLEVGGYSVQAFNATTRCYSNYQSDSVRNDAVIPNIDVDPVQPMTNCINPDGVFSVEAIDPTGTINVDDYIYHWYVGADTLGPRVNEGRVISNVRASAFTIVVTDPITSCKTIHTADLKAENDLLPVFVSDPVATHIETCPGTGTVSTEVDLVVGAGDSQDDYVFYWFPGKSAPQSTAPGASPGDIDTLQAINGGMYGRGDAGRIQTNLSAGFYTVLAVYPPDGCQSIPRFVEVKQIARKPVIQLIASQPDSLCNTLTGELEIQAKKATDDTTPLTSYTYSWVDDGSINSGVRTGLAAGDYTVTVTDNQTGCFDMRMFTVRNRQIKPVVTAVADGNDICLDGVNTPTGSITVDRIGAGSTVITSTATFESDYNFYLYANQSDFDASNPANNALKNQPKGVNNYLFTDLNPGSYYVAAENDASGCLSPFLHEVEVPDDAPVMTLSLKEQKIFIECTDSDEGKLRVEVQNAVGGFAFNWYEGVGVSGSPVLGAINAGRSSTIENLTNGEYTVEVIDQSGQACTITETFTVDLKQVDPLLSASKISDQTVCNADGSIRVNGIQLNGSATDTTQYTITWYKDSADPAGAALFASGEYYSNPSVANQYDSLDAGVYFILAEAEFVGGCQTNIEQVTITDQSTELQVTGKIFNNYILACDPSQFAEGEIEIVVLNTTNFTTAWYRGENVDDMQKITGLANNAVNVQGLAPGTYTVKVTDTDTGCEAIRQYTIQGISIPLAAFPSAQVQISCIANDGAVGVTINGGRGNYSVRWYAGTDTLSNPINPNGSYVVENLSSGTYTVAVTDKEDLSCGTVVEQITVADRSGNDLVVTVDSDRPMTNCDDGNPNGQLSATIDDEEALFRYEFFWYAGSTTAGNPIAFGPTATALGENTYTVIARDRVTGCLSDPFTGGVVTVLDSGLLPAPTARMLSPVTRCTEPNGSAEAFLDSTLTVDPNVDYEFIWYNAQDKVVYSSSRSNVVSQLDTGSYSVIVRNTITGCLSAPGQVYIGENIYVPEFEIKTSPSFCDQPSGTLTLVLNEPFDVVNIEWTTPYGFNNGFFLDNQPAGEYIATLTDASGCQITQEARVMPGIQVYNAVSPNGDQKNDIFAISCIGDFENNIVRIYNRTGSLVYEHVGYDNETIFFEGYGNRGVYVGRKELPDGTYFYIVDKRNGDEPESGYLELLR